MTHDEAVERIKAAGLIEACHGNLPRVREIFKADPSLIDAMNSVYASCVDETPQGAAAHTGSKAIVEFLLAQGVELDAFMAAAIGDTKSIAAILHNDSSLARATGAHGIPIIAHAPDRAAANAIVEIGVDCDIVTAVNLGLTNRVAALLGANPSEIHTYSEQGVSLIRLAVATGDKIILKALLEAGADDPDNVGTHFLVGGEVTHENHSGQYFYDTNLHGAGFNNVNLGRSTFYNVNLSGAVLVDVNLSRTVIDFATINGLKICGVEVQPLIEAELNRRRQSSQLLPTHLSPTNLGLNWGLSRQECLEQLGHVPIRYGDDWISATKVMLGKQRQIGFYFDEAGLNQIHVFSHISKDFWYERDYDEFEVLDRVYLAVYKEIVAATSVAVGQPDYMTANSLEPKVSIVEESGVIRYHETTASPPFSPDGLPPSGEDFQEWIEGLFEGATATLWKREDAFYEVQFDKQDTELPFTIEIAAMRPKDWVGNTTIAAPALDF